MTTTITTPAGDNLKPALDALNKTLRKLGQDEAEGVVARPTAALAMAHAAHRGEIDESYAETGYTVDLAGKRKLGNNPLATEEDATGKTYDVQVSKFRQCIKVSMLPAIDGPDLLDRAIRINANLRTQGTKTLAPFEGMLAVARAQLKDATVELSNDDIADLVTVKDKEKPELADLIAAYKTADKLAKKYGATAAPAVEVYRRAIVEAGGEVPALTKAEKEQAAAMEFLRRNGMVAVHAIAAQ